MGEPPFYLQPVLHTIESTLIALQEEYKTLNDKDIEFVYERLKEYYRKSAQGKQVEEPLSTSEKRQALIDEILNSIEGREEIEADISVLNNPECAPNGIQLTSLAALYSMGFRRLQKSVRFWRKEFRLTGGYLGFISRHVI